MSFWCLQFLLKNKRKQVDLRYPSCKVEFIHSFFGRNFDLKKSFRFCLTFSSPNSGSNRISWTKFPRINLEICQDVLGWKFLEAHRNQKLIKTRGTIFVVISIKIFNDNLHLVPLHYTVQEQCTFPSFMGSSLRPVICPQARGACLTGYIFTMS